MCGHSLLAARYRTALLERKLLAARYRTALLERKWAERWRRREATGDMIVVRYADDLVLGFQYESDARRFLDALRARFEEFMLQLHPEAQVGAWRAACSSLAAMRRSGAREARPR